MPGNTLKGRGDMYESAGRKAGAEERQRMLVVEETGVGSGYPASHPHAPPPARLQPQQSLRGQNAREGGASRTGEVISNLPEPG